MLHYSPTSQFWINNRVTNSCYRMYDAMEPVVRAQADAFENYQMTSGVPQMDKKLAELVKKGRVRKARKLMTKYTVETAQEQFAKWVALEEFLLVKFIDGNEKSQEEDGSFVHSPYFDGQPRKLKYHGYNERWKAAVARDNGAVLQQR